VTRAIPKARLFERLGYGPPYDALEAALEEAGLSRPERGAISPRKAEAVEALLAARFVAVCSRGDCRAEAASESAQGVGAPAAAEGRRGLATDGDARIVVAAATQADCAMCGGSANRREVDRMVDAWRRAGLARLCVVGGSPNTRKELEDLVAGRLELRLVDGTSNRAAAQVTADLAWADRVALWGGTQLDHKVSEKYRGPNVVQFAKRSIGALAREMVRSVE